MLTNERKEYRTLPSESVAVNTHHLEFHGISPGTECCYFTSSEAEGLDTTVVWIQF
jgi:hypothetical protein